ncbi:MAG: hypothetical protein L0Z52_01970 [Acidobacteria bacterium]|nr:hypothetical protein [Acidobacteriota bacterium]
MTASHQGRALVASQFHHASVRDDCGRAEGCLDPESSTTHQIDRRFWRVDPHLSLLDSLTQNLSLESTRLQQEHRPLAGIVAGVLHGEKLDAGFCIEPYQGSLWKL